MKRIRPTVPRLLACPFPECPADEDPPESVGSAGHLDHDLRARSTEVGSTATATNGSACGFPPIEGEVIYQFPGRRNPIPRFSRSRRGRRSPLGGRKQTPTPRPVQSAGGDLVPAFALSAGARSPQPRPASCSTRRCCWRTGRALEAISRARRWPGIELETEEAERMDRVIIEGFEQAGLHDEARVLAEAWCRTHLPSGASALGWAVLARLALRDENWERRSGSGCIRSPSVTMPRSPAWPTATVRPPPAASISRTPPRRSPWSTRCSDGESRGPTRSLSWPGPVP